MKTRSTQKPIVPVGYTGNDFNKWIKHIHKKLDKVRKTQLAQKL